MVVLRNGNFFMLLKGGTKRWTRRLNHAVFLDAAKTFEGVDHCLLLQSFLLVGSWRHVASMAAKPPVRSVDPSSHA